RHLRRAGGRDDVADPALARRQLHPLPRRDRPPAHDRPARQALMPSASRASGGGLAALALVFNALVWGTSWWPFRWLQSAGLHPLWATALIYTIASAVIVILRPGAPGQVLRTPALWLLVAAAGTTNAAFNWGVVIGDVVRVVLLFYLMPLWTVLLARVLLGERLTVGALLRTGLALVGAAIVLWPEAGGGDAGALGRW